jgi:uncharacterized protein YjbI with pentapeptide repeats
MANEEHLKLIKQGVDVWHRWRSEHPNARPDLSRANLRRASLGGVDLNGANLERANLYAAHLVNARLRGANLMAANLCGAMLSGAVLGGADLRAANLMAANISGAYINGANLSGCRIYSISAWNIRGVPKNQLDLIITRDIEPIVTVDNIEVAQFIYLLLNNQKIRQVIDTITSKVVLILGRFTEKRKRVLDSIREELRKHDYIPVLFDFDKPASKDITGTVETLARMARFIIADLTDPSSIPHELGTIVPFLRTTPVLPIRMVGSKGYSMFEDLRRYNWVLKPYKYVDGNSLISALPKVIAPADRMAEKLRGTRKQRASNSKLIEGAVKVPKNRVR